MSSVIKVIFFIQISQFNWGSFHLHSNDEVQSADLYNNVMVQSIMIKICLIEI